MESQTNEQNQKDLLNQKNNEIKECKTLRTVGLVILISGILLGVILFFSTMFVDSGEYKYSDDKYFNPMCFIYLIASVLPSITIWALFNVISNMSKNLTELK